MKTFLQIETGKTFPNTNPVSEADLREAIKDKTDAQIEIHGITVIRGKGVALKYCDAGEKGKKNAVMIKDVPLQNQLKGIASEDLPILARIKLTGKSNIQLY